MRPIPMTVTPIPGEPLRYWVQSSTRPEIKHVVDLAFKESERSKPTSFCSCERMMAAHDATCKHVMAVVKYEHQQMTTDEEVQGMGMLEKEDL